MEVDLTQDIFSLSGGLVQNVIPGPFDSSGAPLTAGTIGTNTTSMNWAFANLIGHRVRMPRLMPVGSSGPRFEYLASSMLNANSVININADLGVRTGPYLFTSDDPLFLLGNAVVENLEFYGNLGAARAPGVVNNNALVTDRLTASSNVHVRLEKCTIRDFSHTGIANNCNRMTLDDCTITGNGASIIDANGAATGSYMGVWGGAQSCKLTIRGGLFRDMGWNAVYGAGDVRIEGGEFRNNHRQYPTLGYTHASGGHIAMNANSLSCTVDGGYFWNDVGLVTGASALEMEALAAFKVTGCQIFNMPGVGPIVAQGNTYHRIRDCSGSGNANGGSTGMVQTHVGTPLWQQSGNYFT